MWHVYDFDRGMNEWVKEYERFRKPIKKDLSDLGNTLNELLSGSITTTDNIEENKVSWSITIPVPGLKKEDFLLSRKGNKLTLSIRNDGKGLNTRWTKQKSWSWTLDKGVEDKGISAECKDGVMMITVLKPEKLNPKEASIDIK